MSTTIFISGTVQFTFSLVARLNIVMLEIAYRNNCNLILPSLKLESRLKKLVTNVVRKKYVIVELVVTFFTVNKSYD